MLGKTQKKTLENVGQLGRLKGVILLLNTGPINTVNPIPITSITMLNIRGSLVSGRWAKSLIKLGSTTSTAFKAFSSASSRSERN